MVDVLLPEHKAMLAASGIAELVIAERGYRSVNVKAELKRLGFADAQCGVPTLLVPIFGVAGEIVNYHHRPDQPRVNPKTGKANKYEFPKSSRMALDVHPRIRLAIRDSKIPLFITEGVKKADAAISVGLCCIAVIGTWNWRGTNEFGGKTALPDWESIALKGQRDEPRRVYICYDSDVMVKPQVYGALSRLSEFLKMRGANVAYIYLPHGGDGSKVGLDDYLAAGHDVNDLMSLASTELRPAPKPDAGGDDDPDGATVAQKIVALAADAELFHTDLNQNHVRFDVGGHTESWPMRSSSFKNWLRRAYYRKYGKPCSRQPLEDAIGSLEATAQFDGAEHALGVRCIGFEGSIWIDMADEKWRAIQITCDGWQVVDAPPVPMFRRHAAHLSFIEPNAEARPGSVDRLRKLVNVRHDRDWILVVAWLVACFIPDIPHPVLVIHGEQGTAKSTLMKMLGRLIDASATQLRSEPPDIAQWVQAADHSWLVALDNVSVLPNWLSDAICRAVTAEASSKRQLYTDDDDFLYSFRRVVALTGIPVVAQRADLLDRSILLGLDPIDKEGHRPESEVLDEFEAIRPDVVGGLLSAVSGVLRELPNVRARSLPRMADFAKIGIACERVFGWQSGSFMAAYGESISEHNREALASAVIYEPLMGVVESGTWSGTAHGLLDALSQRAGEKLANSPEWPKNARSLSVQLKRIAPNLRAAGFTMEFGQRGRFRPITIRRQRKDSCVDTVAGAPVDPDSVRSCDVCDANDAGFPRLSLDSHDNDPEDDDGFDRALEAIRQ